MGLLGLFFIFRHPSLDKFCTTCIMTADNLPRLGLESVDSFNCAHGEVFLCLLMQYFKPHLSYEQQANLLISMQIMLSWYRG